MIVTLYVLWANTPKLGFTEHSIIAIKFIGAVIMTVALLISLAYVTWVCIEMEYNKIKEEQ